MTYIYYVSDFIAHFEIKDYDESASTSQDKFQIMMEDCNVPKKENQPNTISVPVSVMNAFLDYNNVELRLDKSTDWNLHE